MLYGKAALLEAMPPYQGGGDMIRAVTFEKTIYNDAAVQVRGRHAEHRRRDRPRRGASTTSSGIGLDAIAAHEHELLAYATDAAARAFPGCASSARRATRPASLSFVIDGVHPHDIGTILDREGIAVRAGHHCAQPVMERFGVPATARASFAFYNTREEVDALVAGLHKVQRGVRVIDELRELYQEVILDHSKRPRNFRALRRRRPPAPRATTRCAATRSRVYLDARRTT